jgi:hypothetical protein
MGSSVDTIRFVRKARVQEYNDKDYVACKGYPNASSPIDGTGANLCCSRNAGSKRNCALWLHRQRGR